MTDRRPYRGSSVTGWPSPGAWGDEPEWVHESTWEWEPLPGQRYPGDAASRRPQPPPRQESPPHDAGRHESPRRDGTRRGTHAAPSAEHPAHDRRQPLASRPEDQSGWFDPVPTSSATGDEPGEGAAGWDPTTGDTQERSLGAALAALLADGSAARPPDEAPLRIDARAPGSDPAVTGVSAEAGAGEDAAGAEIVATGGTEPAGGEVAGAQRPGEAVQRTGAEPDEAVEPEPPAAMRTTVDAPGSPRETGSAGDGGEPADRGEHERAADPERGAVPTQRAAQPVPPQEAGGAAASADTVLPGPDSATGAATALRAPTVFTQVVTPHAAKPPARQASRADPELALGSYPWRFHPETLREIVDDADELRDVRERLTAKLEAATLDATRARLLGLRAVVSRILGDLAPALADGRDALAIAERTGELRRTAIVQARLAHVLQWRGDFAEADRLFEEANSPELPDRLRATMHEHAGRSCYDQGRYIEACIHFEKALDLRKVEDPGLIARTGLALDAVMTQVAEKGWGPYPRSREEILQLRRPPAPAFSERAQRWGYRDVDGAVAVPPRYADAQPFHDDLAWVRRPERRAWELIDTDGETVVDASAGFVGANSFSDGLAWVSRDGHAGWFAIDRTGRMVISAGFDDVRPFRRGVAAVRRGGWGAVDTGGRMVVPPRYAAFVTALTDGRYVDGFTDEGLAVVDTINGKGVIDRAGRVIVSPRHPVLVIHPVAFLVADARGRWGALDRRGAPLIDVVHASRGDVTDEIDRLLADTYPLL